MDDSATGEQDKDEDQQNDDVEGTLGDDGWCCEYEDKEHNDCDE